MSGKARYEINYKAIYCFDIDRLWSFFKLIGPIILLIIYTLIGALIFSLAEADHEKQQRLEKNLNYTKFKNDALKELKIIERRYPISRMKDEKINFALVRLLDDFHIRQDETPYKWTFLGSLYYSMTLYTTIGYGDFAPQTTAGKILTMIYIVLGIPVTLGGIIQMGTMITSAFIWVWIRMRMLYRACRKGGRRKPSIMDQQLMEWQAQQSQAQLDSEARNMDILSLPLSFVCLMTAAWVVLAAALFLLWEDDWCFFASFYFTVVSFSTVGLGDMTPDYTRATVLLSIIFMLAGVALLSAFFSLLREQTDSLFDQLELDVDKQYLSGQLMGDRALPMSTEKNEIDAEIQNLMTKMPWSAKILYWLSSEKRKKNLAKRWSKKANRRPIGTQTEEKYSGSSGFGKMGGNRRASDGQALDNNRKSKCDVDSLVDMCDYDI